MTGGSSTCVSLSQAAVTWFVSPEGELAGYQNGAFA
jgi:hypothetical protein